MSVHEVRSVRRAPRGLRVRREKRGHERDAGSVSTEIRRDAVAVGDAEVAEAGRRDDGDFHARRPQVLDSVADESAGDVTLVPRVRGGQHGDSHTEFDTR